MYKGQHYGFFTYCKVGWSSGKLYENYQSGKLLARPALDASYTIFISLEIDARHQASPKSEWVSFRDGAQISR